MVALYDSHLIPLLPTLIPKHTKSRMQLFENSIYLLIRAVIVQNSLYILLLKKVKLL